MEVTVFAHPEILVTRLARNIFVAGAGEGIVNEPRAIHSSAIWVRRTISIGQMPLGQSKRRPDEFLDLWRLTIEFAQIVRSQTCHRWRSRSVFCFFFLHLIVAVLTVRCLLFVTFFGRRLRSRGCRLVGLFAGLLGMRRCAMFLLRTIPFR